VTGASSGIGAEIARELAARGHGVTLVARRTDRLEELARELADRNGIEAPVIPCDLADPAARESLVATLGQGKALVGLVNNAGFGAFGNVTAIDAERQREMVELNVAAVVDLTTRLLPGMIERGRGAILNVATTAAFQPLPGVAVYGATNAFVLSFSEALSVELKGSGVSCTALCPGPVKTEFSQVAGSTGMESRLPDFTIVAAEDVARQAVNGMQSGKRVVVPGLPNKVSAVGGRLTPRALMLPVVQKMMEE